MDAVLSSPGTYVVAVSGGVDSMVLLDLLARQKDYDLIVAHVDHGIRPDSAEDRRLVGQVAQALNVPFEYYEAGLDSEASEDTARKVRYDFLFDTARRHGAHAVVTAHHQDDVLETAVINIMRGTNRKGLTSLASREGVERPLLDMPKRDIIMYAEDKGLEWHEDSTNFDTDYLRNYARHELLPRFDTADRARLLQIISGLRTTNSELDELLGRQLAEQAGGELNRGWFAALPHTVARETMAAWLRGNGLRDFDAKALERLVVAAKTAEAGKTFDVLHGAKLAVGPRHLALIGAER